MTNQSTSANESRVQISRIGPNERVLQVNLSRPEKKNALTQAMYEQLLAAVEQAEQDSSISAVLFTGDGDAFCAGNDLQDFLNHGALTMEAPVFKLLYKLASTNVPTLAAVQGPAVGIGTTLLLHCDIIIAADNASFVLPFVDLALVPEAASSLLLPDRIGYARAAQMLLLGDAVSAFQADNWGLINKVVPVGELMQATHELVNNIAKKPQQSLRNSKQLMRAPAESIEGRITRELEVFMQALASDEAQQTIAAVLAARKKS